MRHAERGIVVACLALALGCGANGQEPAPTAEPKPVQTATEDQSLEGQFVAPHERRVTFDLEFVEVAGACKLQVQPPPDYTSQGRAVHWRVLNSCDTDQTVRLADWRIKGTGTAEFPFVQAPGTATCTAGADRRFCKITLTVSTSRPGNETGVWVYTYTLRDANGEEITDPELIIEWF